MVGPPLARNSQPPRLAVSAGQASTLRLSLANGYIFVEEAGVVTRFSVDESYRLVEGPRMSWANFGQGKKLTYRSQTRAGGENPLRPARPLRHLPLRHFGALSSSISCPDGDEVGAQVKMRWAARAMRMGTLDSKSARITT